MEERLARLEELQGALRDIESDVTAGERAIAAAADAERHLNELGSLRQRVTNIRNEAAKYAIELNSTPIGVEEALESALERIVADVVKKKTDLETKLSMKREVLRDRSQKHELIIKRTKLARELKEKQERLHRNKSAMEKAEKRVGEIRKLVRQVLEAQNKIMNQVFDTSLNKVWRDLFVRLAPDEPFVPTFALSEIDTRRKHVKAVLETHYRSGGKGGNPRAVLSSGNLNTAALTLFLALHLSVKPTLSWLIIDDPVQSMDDVHVAQFAALLRTISKQHNRQIILAVHEKPLFDYLSLELSPAFKDDKLLTIEIDRALNGKTVVNPKKMVWEEDLVRAA